MAIQNINSLNNPAAFNLDQATEDYLIQALANLGQRYSIKGDGVGINTISFIELFEESYESSSYIGKISYSTNSSIPVISLNVVNLTDLNIKKEIRNDENTNYEISFDSDHSLNINELGINGLHNICIYYDEHYIVFSMVLHSKETIIDNGEETEVINDIAYVCEKYDKYSGELISAIRLSENESTNKLIYLAKNSEDQLKINYDCTILEYESSDFNIKNVGSQNFVTSHGINNDTVSSTYSFTPESILTAIYKGLTNANVSIEKISTRTNNVFISFEKETQMFSTPQTIGTDPNAETNAFYDELTSINNYSYDIKYIYPEVKLYFSNHHYKDGSNSNTLVFKVLENLLNELYAQYEQNIEIYVPLDYKFEYAYNTNDPCKIYFSTHDIAVRFAPEPNNDQGKITKVNELNNPAALICLVPDVEKVSFYNYSIEYDDNSDNIYSINVNKHYDLPYINENGYWVIDGIESEIYAKGKDAGNPNIIVVRTHSASNSPEIITAADKEFLLSMTWEPHTVQVKLPQRFVKTGESLTIQETKINNLAYVTCSFLVPSISSVDANKQEEYIEKLKYAIIFNIADLDLIEEYSTNAPELNKIYGVNGKINSIWTLNDNNVFECKTHDGYAIDLNYLANMENLIGWTLNNYIPQDPDNFLFSYLVFDDVNKQTKNNDEALFDVYPTLSNKTAMKYPGNYANEYNIVLQYFDTLSSLNYDITTANGNNVGSTTYSIRNIGQSTRRYFDNWYDISSTKTSNEIYPKANGSYAEYLPSHSNSHVPILDLAEVFVKDNTVLNRTNIMSLDASGTPYYAYLGTDYNNIDKSVLVLGTSYHNINIGTSTMTSSTNYKTLSTHSELNINFDNTRISSYAYLVNDAIFETDTITYGTNWTKSCINNVSYWNTTMKPVGSFINSYIVLAKINQENYGFVPYDEIMDNMFIECRLDETLISTSNQRTEFYIGDSVSLPYLFTKKLMPQVFSNKAEFNSKVSSIKSNNEIISYTTANSTAYVALKVSSSNLNNSKNDIYIGPELNISYYVSNGNVYIEINENEQHASVGLPHRIKTNYDDEDTLSDYGSN